MSDINSGLPFRSQLPGQVNYDDILVKLVDATNISQGLAIDSAGLIGSKLFDGAGTAITSQVNGSQRALDVGINVSGVQIDPRSIRALTASDVVTANQGAPNTNANSWFVRLSDGTNNSAILSGGELKVAVTQLLSEDHNFGTAGVNTLRVASLIGNATGSADFDYGTVGAQTIRVAAQLGNATGELDYGNGASGAQTIRVAANIAIDGNDVSATNPIPVVISQDGVGTEINDYNTASAVPAGSTSNHDYTVSASKTLILTQIEATASGRAKIEVQVESSAGSDTFITKFVLFNSTSEPNMTLKLSSPLSVSAGVKVRIVRTNRDLLPQDVYSTICGQEI